MSNRLVTRFMKGLSQQNYRLGFKIFVKFVNWKIVHLSCKVFILFMVTFNITKVKTTYRFIKGPFFIITVHMQLYFSEFKLVTQFL